MFKFARRIDGASRKVDGLVMRGVAALALALLLLAGAGTAIQAQGFSAAPLPYGLLIPMHGTAEIVCQNSDITVQNIDTQRIKVTCVTF